MKEFNQIRFSNRIAREEPMLTADEVVAAILRAIEADEFPSAGVMRVFKQIALSRTLPADVTIEHQTSTVSANGYDFDYWMITLAISAPGDRVGYSFTVRRRMFHAHRAITAVKAPPIALAANRRAEVDREQIGQLLFAHFRELGFVKDDDAPEFAIPFVLVQPVSNDDLLLVSQVPDLQRLSISHGNVTGEGLRHLQTLSNLQSLDLSYNPITDEDLAELLLLKNLESLDLTFTKVTDEGLMQLQGLPKLSTLHLRLNPESGITTNGLRRLGKAMPQLKVSIITQ